MQRTPRSCDEPAVRPIASTTTLDGASIAAWNDGVITRIVGGEHRRVRGWSTGDAEAAIAVVHDAGLYTSDDVVWLCWAARRAWARPGVDDRERTRQMRAHVLRAVNA